MGRSIYLKFLLRLVGFIAFSGVTIVSVGASHVSISLSQAEQSALYQSHEIKSLQAKSDALRQSAIAADQLSDPKLMLGAMNVPADTFNFSQEPMTQIQVGLVQTFPRGQSLRYRSLQQQDTSHAEYEKRQATRVKILRDVRTHWLKLYYWLQAKRIVVAQKKVFRHLVNVTASMLAHNKAQQRDVIRSQLALTQLDNQLIEINQHIDTARYELARWIGISLARRAYPNHLPQWKKPPALINFDNIIKHHPELRTEQAFIAASRAAVKLAQQQFMPGFSLGVAYGFRQGHRLDGKPRSDLLSAQVSIDLPFFTGNRQDRRLKASEENLIASEENQRSHYRQLRELLHIQYTVWLQQQKSAWLYRRHIVPEAKQYVVATMTSYQNAQTDFPTLAKAYAGELTAELMGLKSLVNRDVARVNLLYFGGK